jgi:hypothetical protein
LTVPALVKKLGGKSSAVAVKAACTYVTKCYLLGDVWWMYDEMLELDTFLFFTKKHRERFSRVWGLRSDSYQSSESPGTGSTGSATAAAPQASASAGGDGSSGVDAKGAAAGEKRPAETKKAGAKKRAKADDKDAAADNENKPGKKDKKE